MRNASRARKPDPRTAMKALITQARAWLEQIDGAPWVCTGDCSACRVKQLEVFEQELAIWEERLAQGATPRLGDLHQLAQLGLAIQAESES
jgi:hypothetical protein